MQRPIEAKLRKSQQGAVLVLVTVAMIALIAIAGLALDGGHLLLNKTRLQNAVDAAALSGARTFADYSPDAPGAESAARAAALATFISNLELSENNELSDAYADGGAFTVEFSKTLNPFDPGSAEPGYVRVIADDLSLASWLVRVVGVDNLPVSASAVAGTIKLDKTFDNVLPILICGCDKSDPSCNHDDELPGDGDVHYYHGLPYRDSEEHIESLDDLMVLKASSQTSGDPGPGNFHLLRFEDEGGKEMTLPEIQAALAGAATHSVTVGEMESTKPGNSTGPVEEGINTRFGDASKKYDVPADPVTETWCENSCQNVDSPALKENNPYPLYVEENDDGSRSIKREGSPEPDRYDDIVDFATYAEAEKNESCNSENPDAGCWRRVVALPIGQCSTATSGAHDVPIYGVGCFFLTQKVLKNGNESEIYGQFVGGEAPGCSSNGRFSDDSDPAGPLPTKIVLFRDFGSEDS
ncbi:Tad domain-containing protein [Marinobacterium weihaiense]|uniref:Tad domain-containing protein n=1 Tax=Marinobacterium weihaiense TaxID=2851016 RepID=A0ABS6MCC4_9GAMM|nr:Tad domain-containing protein [Marinobacterium weihaiense]MBV0933491.1 Tad domain-containing protein [Marinobacterium weihaiense]